MLDTIVAAVREDVAARVGDDLRVVTAYAGNDFETRMRPDVRRLYTPEDDREVVDQTILDQLSTVDSAGAVDAGELAALVRVFEAAWIVSWPAPRNPKAGVIVSIQRDGASDMADVSWVIEYLDREVAGRFDGSSPSG